MHRRRPAVAAVMLVSALARPATAQQVATGPDSADTQIRAVLRAFYHHRETQNWDALSAYVLSPKLLERRGTPGDLEPAARNRARSRGASHGAATAVACSSSRASAVEEATIRLDGDWAEVSVPRCSAEVMGVDEFRMLYFEERWRFIYTDLFEAAPTTEQ